jgi:glycosyltransferase involved in cell wall biosynthesis
VTRALHWVQDSPSPYNAALFRALAADPALDLTVHYIRDAARDRPWQTPLTEGYRWREFRRKGGADWALVRRAAKDRDGYWLVSSWYESTTQLLITSRLLRGLPCAIWTDTPNLGRQRHAIKAVLRSRWLRWVLGRADAVLGTGTPALDALRTMGAPTERLINFPYFIDTDAYAPTARRPGSELTFVSSGRLHPDKGYDVALRALAEAYRGAATTFRYRIAGVGPNRDELVTLARELGIVDRVEFLGWVEPAELVRLLADSDVLLHPARYEPYGVAVVEGLASGLVVIGSDATTAVLDRIRPGVNGLMHRSGDAAALAREIVRVRDDAALRTRLAVAARAQAEAWPLARAVTIVRSLCGEAQRVPAPARCPA